MGLQSTTLACLGAETVSAFLHRTVFLSQLPGFCFAKFEDSYLHLVADDPLPVAPRVREASAEVASGGCD